MPKFKLSKSGNIVLRTGWYRVKTNIRDGYSVMSKVKSILSCVLEIGDPTVLWQDQI